MNKVLIGMDRSGSYRLYLTITTGMDPETKDSAVFFGLSGTGKTTLSADPARILIGDDEHGWTDHGIFNFEGGCYAKCIDLDPEGEPEIFGAIKFGSEVENVILDPETRKPDYADRSITENTRVGYPIDYIPNAAIPGVGGVPKVVIFLTADAFGVLPPISRLGADAAMYHFVTGFTAKVAGTERGITEPVPTFSTLFGQPFMELHLDRKLSEKRIFPAISLNLSGTRREDLLMTQEEMEAVWYMTGDVPTILRPGIVTKENIEAALGKTVELDPTLTAGKPAGEDFQPKAPGMKYKHYAPKADMLIVEGNREAVKNEVERLRILNEKLGNKVGILLFEEKTFNEAAHEFFADLRDMDEQGVDMQLRSLKRLNFRREELNNGKNAVFRHRQKKIFSS